VADFPLSKIPVISGAAAVKAFKRAGWSERSRSGTSHITMFKTGNRLILTIPQHKAVKKPLLKGLIIASGLTLNEFLNLL